MNNIIVNVVTDCVRCMNFLIPFRHFIFSSLPSKDVTAEAKRIAAEHVGGGSGVNSIPVFGGAHGKLDTGRVPVARSYTCRGKLTARNKEKIQYGDVSRSGFRTG